MKKRALRRAAAATLLFAVAATASSSAFAWGWSCAWWDPILKICWGW